MGDTWDDGAHAADVRAAAILTLHLLHQQDISKQLNGEWEWPEARYMVADEVEEIIEDLSVANAMALATAIEELRSCEIDPLDEAEWMRIGPDGRANWETSSERWHSWRDDSADLASLVFRATLTRERARIIVDQLTERVGPGWEDIVNDPVYSNAN